MILPEYRLTNSCQPPLTHSYPPWPDLHICHSLLYGYSLSISILYKYITVQALFSLIHTHTLSLSLSLYSVFRHYKCCYLLDHPRTNHGLPNAAPWHSPSPSGIVPSTSAATQRTNLSMEVLPWRIRGIPRLAPQNIRVI